jgi:glycosyltransferase involved in cell wall biosynthesis
VIARTAESRPAPADHAVDRSGDQVAERRVNVLLVASALWIGGAETVVRHLAETLDRRRFNVSVVCLKQRGHIGDLLARNGIDITAFQDEETGADYFTFRKLRRLVLDRRIDVVHTHTTHGLVDATICRLLVPGLQVVHTFHFGNYPHTRRRVMAMELVCSRLATRLFAVGEAQRAQLRRVYRFAERSIGTIWNGVALPPLPGDRSLRDRIGAGEQLLVGTIATLIEQKGLRDVMRVARRLRDRGVEARFVIVGEGQLRDELEALRRELGLEDAVQFAGWITSAAEAALPAFDVFFQPSLWEAMSVVTLEAMAAGKPVVVTRVGEASRIIEDGVDGLLVTPADVDGMAAALARLLGDAELRARMGAAARATVERQLTIDHMTRAYERVYLEAAGAR